MAGCDSGALKQCKVRRSAAQHAASQRDVAGAFYKVEIEVEMTSGARTSKKGQHTQYKAQRYSTHLVRALLELEAQ